MKKQMTDQELNKVGNNLMRIANDMANFYEDTENESVETLYSAIDCIIDYMVDNDMVVEIGGSNA